MNGRKVALCTAATAWALLGAADARASAVSCGDVVTTDVVLERSLVGCDAGLVVGADEITIDLDGHAIVGTGAEGSVGILAEGRTGVTVEDGAIRGFPQGIRFTDASDARIEQVAVAGASLTGIGLDRSDGSRVLRNAVVGSGTGFFMSGDGLVMEQNAALRNELGIVGVFGQGLISRNVAIRNRRDGIHLVRFPVTGGFERNVANGNGGTGIRSDDSHGRYLGNVTNANGEDGLRITDTLPDHGRFFTVSRSVANANGGLGIFVPPGTLDGGQNRAHANGDVRQCVNLACN